MKPNRYTGQKVHDERLEVLLEAVWRPAAPEAFPDLPQSPKANGSANPAFTPPPAAAGYVAPHLRGSGGEGLCTCLLLHCASLCTLLERIQGTTAAK